YRLWLHGSFRGDGITPAAEAPGAVSDRKRNSPADSSAAQAGTRSPSPQGASDGPLPANRFLIFAVIALGGAAIDLATKHWIFGRLGMPHEQPSWWLIDEIFGFTTSLNEGALFGIGQGRGLVFSALSISAAIGIVCWLFVAKAARDLLLTVALGCVTAG